MSTTQRVVRKQLAGAEDLLQGVGTVTQTRGTGTYPIHKLDVPTPMTSVTEMQESNFAFVRLYFSATYYVDYRYNAEATAGIIAIGRPGYWEYVSASKNTRAELERAAEAAGLNLVAGSFQEGATVTAANDVVYNHIDGQYYGRVAEDAVIVAALSVPDANWEAKSGLTLLDAIGAVDMHIATECTDFTGATDYSTVINDLLAKYNIVRLPDTGSGYIRADITVPSGKTLLGSGRKVYSTSLASWSGPGTLLKGSVSVSGKVGWTVGNLAIDAYDLNTNSISGTTSSTVNGFVKNLSTRANNHGQLWEQNGSSPLGANGGNIVVEDCIHYEGPNGFVTKMKGVSFIRCKADSVTVQGFVVVSDNINGQGIFSRASDTLIEDCEAVNCNTPIRIYSRNYHPGVDTVNTTSLTKIINFKGGTPAGNHIRSGDFEATATAGGFTRILNDDIIITGGYFIGAPYNSIHVENANRIVVDGGAIFGSNGKNIAKGDTVYALTVGEVLHVNAPAAGSYDLKIVTVTDHTTGVDLFGNPDVVVFNNASPSITVSATTGLTSVFGKKFTFKIADKYTSCTFTGVTHSGAGTVFDAYWDGSAWIDLGERVQVGEYTTSTAQAAVVVDFGYRRKAYLAEQAGVSITSITMAAGTSTIPAGELVQLRITNSAASNITIAGWDANFKFAEGLTAPASLAAYRKLILNLYSLGGGVFVVTSFCTYN